MCEKTLFLAVCNSYVNCIGFYHINRKVSFMEVDQRSVLAGQQIKCGRANLECSVAIVNFSLPVAQKSFTVHVAVGQAGLLTQSLFCIPNLHMHTLNCVESKIVATSRVNPPKNYLKQHTISSQLPWSQRQDMLPTAGQHVFMWLWIIHAANLLGLNTDSTISLDLSPSPCDCL